MSSSLEGKVVALVGRGTDFDRAVAVGCAERGAMIALGTVANVQDAAGNAIGPQNSASNLALPVTLSAYTIE